MANVEHSYEMLEIIYDAALSWRYIEKGNMKHNISAHAIVMPNRSCQNDSLDYTSSNI